MVKKIDYFNLMRETSRCIIDDTNGPNRFLDVLLGAFHEEEE